MNANAMRRVLPLLGLLCLLGGQAVAADAPGAAAPNILLIYADDLGYGDVGCYAAAAVKTPNVDRLAREGLRFTSGYCTSATCTPSRYSLLTGEYAFRRKGTGILPGDAALIVPTNRATLPSILQKAGYATGIVGKWHLGLGAGGKSIDWNAEIKPGPREVGFDYSFWKDEDMVDTFTRKGVEFIERNRDRPFFLYFATHDIHVPRVPHPRFVGKTTMGARGDAIVQFDSCVGELLATLDRLGLARNTLVILSSDNGPVLDDGYKDGAVEKLGDPVDFDSASPAATRPAGSGKKCAKKRP